MNDEKTIRWEETGEVRPPLTGEWFEGYNGFKEQARFDFKAQSFPILRLVVEEVKEKDTTIKDMLNKKSKIWTALEEANGHN